MLTSVCFVLMSVIPITSSSNITGIPSMLPSILPSLLPTDSPSLLPSPQPSLVPTRAPTLFPTSVPTAYDIRVLSGSGSCTGSNCAAAYTFDLVEFQLDDAWTSVFLSIDGLKGDLATTGVEYVMVYVGGVDTGIRCSTSVDCGGSAGMINGVGDTCIDYLNVSEYAPSGAARGSKDELAARLLLEIELKASSQVNGCSPYVAASMRLYVHFDPSSFAPTNTPLPTPTPTYLPTSLPTIYPTHIPSVVPTFLPSPQPSQSPSTPPTPTPSHTPTPLPSIVPSILPTSSPTPIPPLLCSGACGCSGCSNFDDIIVAVVLCCFASSAFIGYYCLLKSSDRLRRQRDSVDQEEADNNHTESSWVMRSVEAFMGTSNEFLLDIPTVEFRRTRRYRAAVVAARVLKKELKNAPSIQDRAERGDSAMVNDLDIANTPKNATKVDVNVGGVRLGAALVEETTPNSDWIEVDENDEDILGDEGKEIVKSSHNMQLSSPFVSSTITVLNHQDGDKPELENKAFALSQSKPPSTSSLKRGHILLDRLCTICLVDINDKDETMELNCFHYYHADCLQSWLEVSTTCPLCKQTAVPPPRRFLSSIYVSAVLAYEDVWMWLRHKRLSHECSLRHFCGCLTSISSYKPAENQDNGDRNDDSIEMTHSIPSKTKEIETTYDSDVDGSDSYLEEDRDDEDVDDDSLQESERHISTSGSLRERAQLARAVREARANLYSMAVSPQCDSLSMRNTNLSSIFSEGDDEPSLEYRLLRRSLQKEAALRGGASLRATLEMNDKSESSDQSIEESDMESDVDENETLSDEDGISVDEQVVRNKVESVNTQASPIGANQVALQNIESSVGVLHEVRNELRVEEDAGRMVGKDHANSSKEKGRNIDLEGTVEIQVDEWADHLVEQSEDLEDWGDEIGVVHKWESSDEEADVANNEANNTSAIVDDHREMSPISQNKNKTNFIASSDKIHEQTTMQMHESSKSSNVDEASKHLDEQLKKHHQEFSANHDIVEQEDIQKDEPPERPSQTSSGDSGSSHSVSRDRSLDTQDSRSSSSSLERDSETESESERESDLSAATDLQDQGGYAKDSLSFATSFGLIPKDLQYLVTCGELTFNEAMQLSGNIERNTLDTTLETNTTQPIPLGDSVLLTAGNNTKEEGVESGEHDEVRGAAALLSTPSELSRHESDQALAEVEQFIEEFELEKEKAVRREDYVRAEELRREIVALKSSLNNTTCGDGNDIIAYESESSHYFDHLAAELNERTEQEKALDALEELLLELEVEKRKAVALNNFKRADELRAEIREIKSERDKLSSDVASLRSNP